MVLKWRMCVAYWCSHSNLCSAYTWDLGKEKSNDFCCHKYINKNIHNISNFGGRSALLKLSFLGAWSYGYVQIWQWFCPTRGLVVACVQLILKNCAKKEYSASINSQEKCYSVPYQKAKVKLFPFQFHFKYNEKYKVYKHQQFQLWKERRGIFRITLTCTSSKYSSIFNPFSNFCKPVCILIQVSLKLAQ